MSMKKAVFAAAIALIACPSLGLAQGEVDLGGLQLEECVFIYKSSEAKVISVVGDFNGWNHTTNPLTRRGTDDSWSAVVRLRKGKVYEYAFCVDGALIPDPANPVKTSDGRYSIYFTPGTPEKDPSSVGIDFADAKALPAVFRRLEERLNYLTQTLSSLSQQIIRYNDALVSKDAQIELLRKDCESLRLEKVGMSRDLVQEQAKLAVVTKSYEELRAESGPLADRLREADKVADENKRIAADRQKKLNDALNEKLTLEQKLKTAEERLAAAEKTLLETPSRPPEQKPPVVVPPTDTTTPGTDTTEPPPTDTTAPAPGSISGSIIVISPRSNLVAIDVGRQAGVEPNDGFLVVREGKIIAKLSIESVDGDALSLARVAAPYKKEDLRQGDTVQSVK
ncbi:MAG: hypothetical protein RDV41_12025 [Planctomycetota bacterium]|nr:hypothetical protein [Planctomycetota bacterium]